MEVANGRTIVTAKAAKDAHFRIECDRLELQAPNGCVRASGKVIITGEGVSATSNVMILNLQEYRITLEGVVSVMSVRHRSELVELSGDALGPDFLQVSGDRLNLQFFKKRP
jgi:lipopolysaccharide assembly outer membrane protein LptD (OstA)